MKLHVLQQELEGLSVTCFQLVAEHIQIFDFEGSRRCVEIT